MEVFEKPCSFFQVGKFNPFNSSCLASYNTCIYFEITSRLNFMMLFQGGDFYVELGIHDERLS